MSIELYYTPVGFPSRSVLLLARALDISLELRKVDISLQENMAEDFVQMNPQHTVPFLIDGDLQIAESGAILMYLADEYAKDDDSLYPKDNKDRAIVNQRLFFCYSSLVPSFATTYLIPVVVKGTGINEEMMDTMDDAVNVLNTYLEGKPWAAGDKPTIADYALITVVSTVEGVGYDLSKYENITGWLERCKESIEDYEDLNQSGVEMMATFFAEKLSQLDA